MTQEERDSFEKWWGFFQQFVWHPAPSATIGEATSRRVEDWMFDAVPRLEELNLLAPTKGRSATERNRW